MTQQEQSQAIQRLTQIEYVVNDIHTRLFGNGQPGELDKLDARLTEQESLTNWAKGAMAVIVGLLTLFGGTEILHITGKL